MDTKGDSDKGPLQTLRARAIDPCDDVMAYIHRQGLGNAVWEIIPLEDAPPPAKDSATNTRPENPILVDLAVDAREMSRVMRHFVPVGLPLSDVSLVSLSPNINVAERQTLLRHYEVHKRYMQQYTRRMAEGILHASLLQWYNNRFEEVLFDERQALNQD